MDRRFCKPLALGFLVSGLAVAASGCGGRTSSSATTTEAASTVTLSVSRAPTKPLALPGLISQIRSGIVRINVTGCGFTGTGTGLLVGPREVVTVEHVVDGARTIKIERGGKVLGKAVVIGADGARDLALVRTKTPITGYRFTISTKEPRLGDSVAVLGYPLGLPLSISKGTVSGLGRVIPIKRVKRQDLIQTDAAVNPGNSGGPLMLLPGGQVVGLVDLGSEKVNGIAFAVSGKVAAKLVAAWEAAPQPLPAARCNRTAPAVSQSQVSTRNQDVFESPSGNIHCAYVNQLGVACITENDGLGVLLQSFDTSYYLDTPYEYDLPGGRVLPYGSTWSDSSFRCSSSTSGIQCWSTLTGHGFFISRDGRNIY